MLCIILYNFNLILASSHDLEKLNSYHAFALQNLAISKNCWANNLTDSNKPDAVEATGVAVVTQHERFVGISEAEEPVVLNLKLNDELSEKLATELQNNENNGENQTSLNKKPRKCFSTPVLTESNISNTVTDDISVQNAFDKRLIDKYIAESNVTLSSVNEQQCKF